jgi:anti-sigma factor RsiW
MITRDNYEEFFLLYTDNELSAAERHAVERFVAEHPDLHEEWETLQQCKLSPDTHLSFPDRNSLFKPEAEGSPYTGELLSYLDGELTATDRERIETILREQPLVARELTTLRQTINYPDPTIVFPDKESLYQKEKGRRIVPLFWLRTGIAAAVLAAIALLWLLPGKQTSQPPANTVAVKQPATAAPTPLAPSTHPTPVAPQATVATVAPAAPEKIVAPVTSTPPVALHFTEGSPGSKDRRPAKKIIEKQKAPDVAFNKDPDDQRTTTMKSAEPMTNAVTVRSSPDVVVSPDMAVGSVAPAGDMAADVHFAVQTGIPKEQSSFATQALQEDEVNDRPKLRGIFRKVTRAFGKTADRDSDGNRQVLVGAFQVSLN